jgi:uncharacterized protein (TIGR00369 family)
MKKLSGTLPWTKSCFVCGEDNIRGLRLRAKIKDGRVSIDYTTKAQDLGYSHIVHGGITTTLIDEVMAWAAIITTGKVCVAAEINVRLKNPVEVGHDIHVEGWIEKPASRICYANGVITDKTGKTLILGYGKYMPLAQTKALHFKNDFVLSSESINPVEIFGATREPAL